MQYRLMNDEEESNIRERSRSFPSYTLAESLQNADMVKKNLGGYPSTREDISKAVGSERISGASAKKIASMVQFGLLRKAGTKYALSELHQKITHPLSTEEKAAALTEAFLRPSLYSQLIEKLRASGAIPEHLRTILIRDFEVLEVSAELASRVFIESALFVGLVGPDLKFKQPAATSPISIVNHQPANTQNEAHVEKPGQASKSVAPQTDTELQEYSFNYWDSDGKTAKLYLLREMTDADMVRLKSFLDLQIKITKKPSAGGGPADG